jgi:hypothetical protein
MSEPPSPDTRQPTARDSSSASDDSPGVPGFRTWRGVYVFVFAAFVVVIATLTWFSRVFA